MNISDPKSPAVRITETVLRDGHQSLLATRLRTEHMAPALDDLDQVGYYAIEMWGGATFDSCIRYLNEDPWQRARQIRAGLKRTPTMMLLRGQNILGYRHYGDDVVTAFVQRAAEAGIDIFRVFDALNDLRNVQTAIRAVLDVGRHAQGAISYTISPVHDIARFVDLARRLEDMGCQSICIKDMAGLLYPSVAFELVAALKAALSVPLELHGHCTSGMAEMVYWRAIEAGVDIVDCALSPLGGGTSQPPTEAIVAALADGPRATGLDLSRLTRLARHFREVRSFYGEFESAHTGIDTAVLEFQIPGGMISNLANQLRQAGAEQRFQEVLDEVPRVRRDMGYPPLVTPTSQIVGTQAAFNVLFGRYVRVTEETRRYLLGHYGQPPAPVDPALQQQVAGQQTPITCRPADLIAPELPRIAAEAGDLAKSPEDVLTLALFPEVGRQFLQRRDAPPAPPAVECDKAEPANLPSTPPAAGAPVPTAPTPAQPHICEPTQAFEVALAGRKFAIRADRPLPVRVGGIRFGWDGRTLEAEIAKGPAQPGL